MLNNNDKDKSTYFYNIQKNEVNVIDEYHIMYYDYRDNNYLYDSYESTLGEYITNKNPEETMVYSSYHDSTKDMGEFEITLMAYSTNAIEFLIVIRDLFKDEDNLHVKISLINLLDIPSSENTEYVEMANLMKKTKQEIIDINKYLNTKPKSKEQREQKGIDNMMEKF